MNKMRISWVAVAVIVLLLGSAFPLLAQDKGFRAEFLSQLSSAEEKVMDLADAIPENKYTWRPDDGVRSISEVYIHIANANYMIPTFFGGKMPEGMSMPDAGKMEKEVTGKKDVAMKLKSSFASVKEVVKGMKDSDLDKDTEFFGMKTTYRGAMHFFANHLHEHLGQSIAYARMNGVVPPWSQSSGTN